jgi:hypothetical protein
MGALRGEPEGRAPLQGTLENTSKKTLVTDISVHRRPIREPEEVGSFIGDFERQVTEGSGNGSSLSLSLSLSLSELCEGNLEGGIIY